MSFQVSAMTQKCSRNSSGDIAPIDYFLDREQITKTALVKTQACC